MKFSYNWLKELLPSLPPPKETAHLLTMHAFEVSDLQRDAGDWVLDIDILPNRMGDASSHAGVARELRAVMAVQRRMPRVPALRLPRGRLREDRNIRTSDVLSVSIHDTEGCLFYSGRAIFGVRVKPSPPWLQKRLRVLGLEPINNIVDATNYVMLELGQPLHAFDMAKLSSEQRGTSLRGTRRGTTRKAIIVRRAKNGEKITTLDGETRTLDPSVAVIADGTKALAIAGMKGGMDAAIGTGTTDIVLESALFDPRRIYRASRLLGVASDASKRFEAGRSVVGVVAALDRVAALIGKIAGGSVARGVVVAGSATPQCRAIAFSPTRARQMLGIPMTDRDARRALEAIGCSIQGLPRRSAWVVNPPAERSDLEYEEDLIEEVGRLIGYHVISRELPRAVLVPATVPPQQVWEERARDTFAAHGCNETMRLSFVNETMLRDWGFDFHRDALVALENPQSAEATILRPTLLPRMLEQAAEGRRGGNDAALFEIGKIFSRTTNGIVERSALGVVVARAKPLQLEGHVADHTPFYELKGIISDLCEHFGLADTRWESLHEIPHPLWHAGKTAALLIGEQRVGIVGEVSPRIAQAHAALGAAAAAELDMEALALVATEEHEYREPSRFPEALRDIAVLVPQGTLVDDVGQEIARVGKRLVRDVELFDYYEGEGVPDGWKSLAFRIVYQSPHRTLRSDEIDRLHRTIEEALRRRGWDIR